jgi:hypothetical protein
MDFFSDIKKIWAKAALELSVQQMLEPSRRLGDSYKRIRSWPAAIIESAFFMPKVLHAYQADHAGVVALVL